MSLLSRLFSARKPNTAAQAKDRLKLLLAHERGTGNSSFNPDDLEKLRDEIINVIKKYVSVTKEDITVEMDMESKDNMGVLEVNITLPERK